MRVKNFSPLALFVFAGVFLLGGCDLFVGDAGRITIQLKDDPFPYTDVSEARVSISRIEVMGTNGTGNWLVSDLVREIELLALRNGTTATLVSGIEIPAGEYSRIRMYLSEEAELTLSDGSTVRGNRGSDAPIVVDVPQFKFSHGDDEARALIDFAMDESFAMQRNAGTQAIEGFAYTPVLRAESFTLNDEPLQVPVP